MPERWVQTVVLPPPSLQDNTADVDRLIGALRPILGTRDVAVDLELAKRIPDRLRQAGWRLRCLLFLDRGRWRLIDAVPADDPRALVGMAVDLGTTRVVLRLIDLETGRSLAESAFDNPQAEVGPDILTRIHFADTPGGMDRLQALIIDGMNREMEALCKPCGLAPEEIRLISLAGNTTMTHLFLGLSPHWIIREPYIPVVNRPPAVFARELGIDAHPLARLIPFPNIGSYFGGDLIAGILFSGLDRSADTAILVDVGTNAEVVLGNENWLIACAGAAGPALEGGVTRMGTTAGPGVIDRIAIDPETGRFDIHTISDLTPRGICGSGLIDLAAQLFLAGMIDMRGRFVPSRCGDRLRQADAMAYLTLVEATASATGEALTLSQADLDSLTRSKAAMYTILETLALTVGISLQDISSFYVAGTFGSFIRAESAISIGMLPDIGLDRFHAIGNSSLGGASRLLSRPADTKEIERIRDRITYLELNVNQDFMNRFSAAKFYPHTDKARFPSVVPCGN